MSSPTRLLSYVTERVKAKFGKTSATLEGYIADLLRDRMREICSDFDYWFLKKHPGFYVPSQFPYADSATAVAAIVVGRFLDEGWFLTEADKEYYKLYTSDVADPGTVPGSRSWVATEASRINFASRYSLEGAFQSNLEVPGSEQYFATTVLSRESASGKPVRIWPHTVDGVTYLRLVPIPDDVYLMCVSFQLAYPPWFSSGGSYTNLMLQYYPRVMHCLAGLEYAEFFHEVKMVQYYMRELFGDTDRGHIRSDIANAGLVGKMKFDTIKREQQDTEEIGFYQSSSDAVGRDGTYRRLPGDSHYFGPSGY